MPTSTTTKNASWGLGNWGARIYSKSLDITITQITSAADTGMLLTFYTKTGSVAGRLSAGVQRSIIKNFEWRDDKRGAGDGLLVLSSLPPFPIIPFTQIGLTLGDSTVENYRGYIRIGDEKGTTNDDFKFTISGLREQLKGIVPNRIIAGPQDIGITAKDIFDTDIQPNSDIVIDLGEFDNTTGVLHQADIQFGKDGSDKVIESLATMANAEAGVNGKGKFFFQVITSDIKKVFFVGYNIQDFKPTKDVEDVKNSIVVRRNQASGSGESGWTVASVENDDSSIAKYGFRELTVKVPGFFDQQDADVIAANVLADRSEPKFTVSTKFKVIDHNDILQRGLYRFVAPLSIYEVDISECDDLTGWTTQGAGDLALSTETSDILSGAGALKMLWSSANGDRAEFTPDSVIKRATSIRLYIKSAQAGSYLTIGHGENSWDENTSVLPVNISSRYQIFEIPVIGNIGKLAIRIDTPSSGQVLIDRIQAIKSDHRHFDLRLERVKYRANDRGITASATFGPVPPAMENFIKQLIEFERDNRSAGEER